jgi:hypothetical protein
MKSRRIKPPRSAQRGLIGILLLVTIAVVAVTVFSKNIWGDDAKTYQQKVNQEALRQAKAALLDYLVVGAVSGGIKDPFNTSNLGRLPCPDQDGNGVSETSCGIGTGPYLLAGYHSLGLLPWATLNSSTIRDASQQCLWYAVDGLYKSSPASTPVNSDSFSSFSVVQPIKPTNPALLNTTWPIQTLAGDLTTVGVSPNRVVAVIIASGSAGGTQTQTSVGGAAYACGLTKAIGGIPNAEASAPDFLKYYSPSFNNQSLIPASGIPVANPPYPTATPAGALTTFITADVGQEQLNDQVAWITAADVAQATTRRVAQLYANQINLYVSKTGFYPWAAATPGGSCVKWLLQGFVPYTCDALPNNSTNTSNVSFSLAFGSGNFFNDVDNWSGQAHYAVSKDCVAKTGYATGSGTSAKGYPYVNQGGSITHPCSGGTDRINLGSGTNGPAAIILMQGRALSNQSSCLPYSGSKIARDISLCLEDPTNISTVHTAFTAPKSYSTTMYNSAPYKVPQTSGSNDYIVQFTTN